MFMHQTHLPQRLLVRHYSDKRIQEREVAELFEPGWHCVGVTAQLPRSGDYLTLELLGRPLIVWNTEQGLRAFLNVCTHRFSTLTDQPCGHASKRLKCQYHGWEYDAEGNTCKIPDAQSFRPLKKGELGLREYRVETVGQLIFVTLNPEASDLRSSLGPDVCDLAERWFAPRRKLTLCRTREIDCNWKVLIENVLESYHIACVHPKSFSEYPVPEHCTHDFHPTYDHYIHHFADEPRYANPEKWASWVIGKSPDYEWHHLLRYPNIILGGAGPYHYVQMVWPVGPNRCLSRWITMHDPGTGSSFWRFLKHRGLLRYGRHIAVQVQEEDARVYPSVHRGTVAPDRPHGGGLISVREERIFAFQDYWLTAMGMQPAGSAESTTSATPLSA